MGGAAFRGDVVPSAQGKSADEVAFTSVVERCAV